MGVRNFIKNVKGSPLWKRTTAGALVLLMLVTLIPAGLSLARADVDRTDLENYISNSSLDGEGVTDNGVLWTVIKEGVKYKLTLKFIESSSLQFDKSGSSELRYQLPEGVIGSDQSNSIDIKILSGDQEYILHNNQFRVSSTDNTVYFKFNTAEAEAYAALCSNFNTEFWLTFDVTFDGTKIDDEIEFSDDIKKDVIIDRTHDASVSNKTCTYENGKLHYVVTMTSDGISENVTVTDALSAPDYVTIDPGTIQYSSSKGDDGGKITWGSKTASGFTGTIDKIYHGEVITIDYYADIDISKMGSDGQFPADNTLNTVSITATDDRDTSNNSKTSRIWNNIPIMTTNKTGTVVTTAAANTDGKTAIVEWTVTVNPERTAGLTAGQAITDYLRSDEMVFDTSFPPQITITKKDNSTTTGAVALNNFTVESRGWSYTIPAEEDGQQDTITITYRTKVNTENYITDTNVTNQAKYRDMQSTSTVAVAPGDGSNVTVGKSGTASLHTDDTPDYITWTVTVNVPKKGFNQSFTVTDTVPSIYDNSQGKTIYENYETAAEYGLTTDGTAGVTGLLEGEHYVFSQDASNGRFTLTFYQSDGTGTPGLKENTENADRVLTITYKTPIDEDYRNLASSIAYAYDHTNNVSIYPNGVQKSDSATVKVSPRSSVTKTGYSDGTYTKDGVDYPIYKYVITIGSPSNDTVTIADTLPEDFVLLTSAVNTANGVYKSGDQNGDLYYVYGGDQYYKGAKGTVAVNSNTDNEFTMTLTLPKKEDNSYYPLYDLTYYAVLKDAVGDTTAYKALLSNTIANANNQKTLTNAVTVTNGTNVFTKTADVTYKADTSDLVDKEITNLESVGTNNRTVKYKVTINPLALDLDDSSDTLTLTDTFSESLSINYSTIKFEPNDGISYDVRGYTLTATIPDNTAITMTYEAKVIGDGTIRFYNTANVAGYKATSDETKSFDTGSSGGGLSSDLSINLIKYKDGDMGTPLKDVQFQLFYDDGTEDGTPVYKFDDPTQPVIVTTGEDGMAKFQGNMERDGWALDYLENGKRYYFKEVGVPNGFAYQITYVHYKFAISRSGNADYSNYVYYNDDIMTVKNKVKETSDKGKIKVTKTVDGDITDFDPTKVTLKVSVAGPLETKIYERTLQQIIEGTDTGDTATPSFAYTHDDDTHTYTWTIGEIESGSIATVEEVVTIPDSSYEVTKTYKVNADTTYSAYEPASVTIGTDTQNVYLKNTYRHIEDGKITVRKTYNYGTTRERIFYFGLFTKDATGSYIPYMRNGEQQIVSMTFSSSALTAANGTINNNSSLTTDCFDNLPYGDYYVFEVDQSGSRITDFSGLEYEVTSGNTETAITLDANDDTEEVEFVNTEKKGSLIVTKHVVVNGRTRLAPAAYENKITLQINGGISASRKLSDIRSAVGAMDGTATVGNNVYTIATDADGNITYTWRLNELVLGQYVVAESCEDITGGYYTLSSMEYSVNGGTTTAFDGSLAPSLNVVANSDAQIDWTNTYTENVGSLRMDKRIDRNGDVPDSAQTFLFIVGLKDRNNNPVVGTQTFGSKTYTFDADGRTVIEVKGGQSQTITNIPAGYTYTVEEQLDDTTGYPVTTGTVGYDKHYSYLSEYGTDGTIAGSATSNAVITNTYHELASLAVTKIVSPDGGNPAIPTTDPFEIYIYLKDANGVKVSGTYPMVIKKGSDTDAETETGTITFDAAEGKATINLCHNWTATISDLEIGYTYRVEEKEYSYTKGVLSDDETDANKFGYKNDEILNPTGTLQNGVVSDSTVKNLYKEKPTALTVTKKLEYPAEWTANRYAMPEDIYFEIEIDFSENTGDKKPASGNHGSVVLDDSGKGTFLLQNGETASITGIPDEAKYVIAEKGMHIGRTGELITLGNYATTTSGIVNAAADGQNVTIKKTSASGTQILNTNTSTTQRDYTDEVTVKNYYMPSLIYIQKLDSNNTPLADAELGIIDTATGTYAKDYKDQVVRWNTTTDNPHAIRGLVADGSHRYILHEITPPDGYVSFADVAFTISTDNQIVFETPTSVAGYTTLSQTNKANDTLSVTDKKTVFKIQKLANYSDTGVSNQPLGGATLAIRKVVANSTEPGDIVSLDGGTELKWTTDLSVNANAIQEITGLPAGDYYLTEERAPEGYNVADSIKFTLNTSNQIFVNGVTLPVSNGVYTIPMVDVKINKIKVSKVKATDDSELAGARLVILKADALNGVDTTASGFNIENYAYTYQGHTLAWISESTGPKEWEIEPGSYILVETVAPDGYTIATQTKFNVGVNGVVNFDGIPSYDRTAVTGTGADMILLVRDTMTSTRIRKVDEAGNRLAGAILQILKVTDETTTPETTVPVYIDAAGYVTITPASGYTWTSSATTDKVIYGLKTDQKYILRETVSPAGYKRTTDTVFYLNEYGNIDTSERTTASHAGNVLLVSNAVTEMNFEKYGYVNEACISPASRRTETEPVAGITFTATQIKEYDENNSLVNVTGEACVKTGTSTDSGKVVIKGLTKGLYEIVETDAVDPYVISNTKYYALVTDDTFGGLYTDQNLNHAVANNRVIDDQYRVNIRLTKVSEENERVTLSGASYGLYYKDPANHNAETLLTTGTTGRNGEVEFNGVLINREYVIRELGSVNGYYLSENPISMKFKTDAGNVTLDTVDTGNDTITYTWNDTDDRLELTWREPDVMIKVAKVDIENHYLAGAKLQIQDMNGEVIVRTFITGDSAYEISGILSAGHKYQLVEVAAPSRDYMIAAPVEFTVPNTPMGYQDADGIVTVTMLNRKYPEIYVSKVDATNEKEVAGAHIQILDEDGNVVVFDNKKLEWDSEVNDYTTKVKIAPGTYTLRETVAPDGYAITTDTKFIVLEDGRIDYTGIPTAERTSTKTVDGRPILLVEDNMTKVSINKVDVTGDQPLAGAHLRILDENGNPVHIDENGYVVTTGGYTEWISSGGQPKQIYGLKTETVYTLEETVAPSGYTITTKTTFVLDQYGRPDTTRSTVSINDENVILVRDNATSLNFEKYGTYNESCIAPPESGDAVKPLAGVGFAVKQILDEDGNAVTDAEPVTGESNENGVVNFVKLPKGTYEVWETSALSRYIPDETVYYAKLTDDVFAGLTYDKEGTKPVENNRLINQVYRTDISFTKVSEIDQAKKLANSTYALFTKKDGTLSQIATAVTDKNGVITFNGVLINTEYVVQEMISPDGYYVSKNPITLGFKLEDGKIVFDKSLFDNGNGTVLISADGSLTWLEPEVVVNFLKKDEDGNPLPGAKLQVVDSNGTIVVEPWISTSTAYQVTGKFKVGETYRLMELASPGGYETADPVAFTIDDSTVANGENKIITITMTDKKETKKTDEKKAPKTGDSTPIQLAVLLAMVSLFVGLIMLDRKLFGKR